jgi:hypothetical protein
LEEIKDWMVSHWEVDREAAVRSVEAFKNKVKVITAMAVKECDKVPDESSSESVTSKEESDGSWEKLSKEEKKKEGKRKMSKRLAELSDISTR